MLSISSVIQDLRKFGGAVREVMDKLRLIDTDNYPEVSTIAFACKVVCKICTAVTGL